MAGLLDSDFVRWASDRRGYYARKDALEAQQQYSGLLGSLEQQGPTQPGADVLGSRAPDQAFWLKAAAIPGLEGLAGQQLSNYSTQAGAMARQQQQQGYEANNMTLAQMQAEDRLRKVADFNAAISQADLARKQAGTQASMASSYASADSSRQSGLLSQARRFEQENKNQHLSGPILNRLTPDKQVEAIQTLQLADRRAEAAVDVADWANNRASGAAIPLLGTSAADAMNTEWQTSVKPMMMQWLNTGVLQEGERKQVEELIGAPSDKMLTKSQLNVISSIAQKVQDTKDDLYKSLGLPAPTTQKGKSAASRTLSKRTGSDLPPAGANDTFKPVDFGSQGLLYAPKMR
jgi:hypothetical protein